jgi:hypothetical protein
MGDPIEKCMITLLTQLIKLIVGDYIESQFVVRQLVCSLSFF